MHETSSPDSLSSLADHDLLRRFVRDADQAAFEEVVRRYQRLVMGICLKVTGNRSDAEDAFQAVFVGLARRPRSIRRESSLSNWLYTVAWRTGLRLVRKRRKQPMETLPGPVPSDDPDPLDQIAADQHSDVLHEELNLLPERYRQVLVMTYFAQQTSQQIADQLQMTQGTVDGQIRQARNMLRVRLARRGVALTVLAVVSSALCRSSEAAAVPPALLDSTIQLSAQTLSNTVPGSVDLSHLEPLIRPEMTAMNLKLVSTVAACLMVVAGAAGMAQLGGVGDPNAGPKPVEIDSVSPAEGPVGNGSGSQVTQAVTAVFASSGAPVAASGASSNSIEAMLGSPLAGEDPRDRWLHEMMDQPIPAMEFRGETPLGEILDFLADHYTETHGRDPNFRMTIWPNDRVLELEAIDSLDDVIVSDIRLKGTPLRQALDLIFEKTEGLTWDIRHGVFEVTTKSELMEDFKHRSSRVYSVGNVPEIEQLVRDHVRTLGIEFAGEEFTAQSSVGAMTNVNGNLIVTHHRLAQEAVAHFLKSVGALNTSSNVGAVGQTVPAAAVSRHRAVSAGAEAAGYIPLDGRSLVVNLNDERMSRYLSVAITLKVDPGISDLARKHLEVQSPAIRDRLIRYFSAMSLDEVRERETRERMRNEIRQQLSEILFPNGDHEVSDILFTEFAVQ